MIPSAIKVTFKEHFSLELIELMLQTEFVGLGVSCRREDPRVLYVEPSSEQYRDLKAQLEELEREGALSFVEEFK
jgi:hypothetical protein